MPSEKYSAGDRKKSPSMGKHWSKDDDALIVSGELSDEAIAKKLGRKLESVRYRRWRLSGKRAANKKGRVKGVNEDGSVKRPGRPEVSEHLTPIGQLLREKRGDRTAEEIAEAAGITVTSLRRLERGQSGGMHATTVIGLARALGIEETEILVLLGAGSKKGRG